MARAQANADTDFSSFEGGKTGGGGNPDDESAGVDYEDGEGMMVDMGAVGDVAKYPVHPRGIYEAELIEMEYGQSQRSGNNMWTTIWELTDPKLADDKGKRPRQWVHLTFNDGGLPRVKQFLARIKCDDEANLTLLKGKFNAAKVADEGTLLGARARLKLDIRRYQGANRNNVRDILPPSNASGGTGFANL